MSKCTPKYYAYDEPVPGMKLLGTPTTCNRTIVMEEQDIIDMMRLLYKTRKPHLKLKAHQLLDEFIVVHYARRVCSICELSV